MSEAAAPAASSRPRASVVIPAYRRTDQLKALLDSLVPEIQANPNVQVVVSDDGSGPEMAAFVAECESRFPNLKYVTGENAGPGVARNRGVAAASSDVLLFVDSDCLVHPGWVNALAGAIEAGAVIAFGPTRSPVPWLEPFVHSIYFEDELLGATNVAFRRATFEALGGFRHDLSHIAEDQDLFTRARASGIVPLRVLQAVVDHPPRLKKVRLPLDFGNPRHFRDLRAFYDSHPDIRARDVRVNRVLFAKGAVKLMLGLTPIGIPAFVLHAMLKRGEVNRHLAAADVDFRVAVGEAVKYGLLQPVGDLLRWGIQSVQMNAL
jgi:glycosyltransferase involved in cell wall biosynthesis